MLLKLPIMLLSNAPKFSLLHRSYAPKYAPLCPIILHKFIKLLLPGSESKPIIFSKLQALNLKAISDFA